MRPFFAWLIFQWQEKHSNFTLGLKSFSSSSDGTSTQLEQTTRLQSSLSHLYKLPLSWQREQCCRKIMIIVACRYLQNVLTWLSGAFMMWSIWGWAGIGMAATFFAAHLSFMCLALPLVEYFADWKVCAIAKLKAKGDGSEKQGVTMRWVIDKQSL